MRSGYFGINHYHPGCSSDKSPRLLIFRREEGGVILEVNQGDVKCIAESGKFRLLVGSINVHAASFVQRVTGYQPYCSAVETSKTGYDIARPVSPYLKEFTIVHYQGDNPIHVIGSLAVGGHYFHELLFPAIGVIPGVHYRWFLGVIQWQEA
ncbi:hypothetical protein ES703_81938 [subsurface metagenome]